MLVLALSLLACDRAADDLEGQGAALGPSPRLYRLTPAQWEASVQDLLALDAPTGLSTSFLGGTLTEGFDNDGAALAVDPVLFQQLQRAAEVLAEDLVGDPERYALVVPQDPREGASATDFTAQVEAEDAEADNGQSYSGLHLLWANGELRARVEVPMNGRYHLSTRLYGSGCPDGSMAAGGLRVDGEDVLTFTSTEVWAEYGVDVALSAGEVELAVFFDNDSLCGGQGDRNFYIDWVALEGLSWLGESRAGEAEARAWIADFGARAHRRPLGEARIDAYHALFEQGPELIGSGDDFADGVRLVVTAVLQSPWFLYRSELGLTPDATGRVPLDDHEIAAKLAFALWMGPPDEALRAAARAGELSEADEVAAQAWRMLQDPRAEAVIDDFHAQLYELDAVDDLDRSDHPAWAPGLGPELGEETRRFLRRLILEEQGGVADLYSARWSVQNAAVANLYGITGPDEGWARVALPDDQRAGLLTHASLLAPRADSVHPSPIQRGVFINRKVLCAELPDPPDDASGLPPAEPGATNRERVEAHTGEGTCGGSCHSFMINPPGFAFEHYDSLGAWRDEDNGLPIDASGTFHLSGGPVEFGDALGLAGHIARSPDAHTCYAWRWLSWTHARAPTALDRAHLAPLAARSLAGASVQDLIVALVSSESFRYRSDEEEEE